VRRTVRDQPVFVKVATGVGGVQLPWPPRLRCPGEISNGGWRHIANPLILGLGGILAMHTRRKDSLLTLLHSPEDNHVKMTISVASRRFISLSVLWFACATLSSAQGFITSGTIVADGGDHPPNFLNIQGSNFSITGSVLGGGLDVFHGSGNATTVLYNPNVSTSIYGIPIGFTYNGTAYSNFQLAFSISGPVISVANTAPPFIAQGGNYQASFANNPFTISGLVTVYSGQSQGAILFTFPFSGSGIFGGTVQGNFLAGGPGGIPNGAVTYQFLPTSTFRTDAVTQGAWNGKYGVDGYSIANGPSSVPSYAALSLSGASAYTWASQTTDPRALQNGVGAYNRIASTYYGNSFSFNLNLTDGLTHQVALYLLDWDTTSRAETITITNLATNTVFDTESLSNFHNGVYAIWNLQGNLKITVTNTGSPGASVAGIFFGGGGNPSPLAPGPPSTATYIGLDTATQGAWTGRYGAYGYVIPDNSGNTNPIYATANTPGDITYVWAAQTADPRAPQSYPGSASRIASAYTQYPNSSVNITLSLTNNNYQQVSFYLLDWDSTTRSETITIRDLSTNTVLDTETFSGFHGGEYATWNIHGNVVVTVTGVGYTTPVISGIFFNN
jgi:hypothetical protein